MARHVTLSSCASRVRADHVRIMAGPVVVGTVDGCGAANGTRRRFQIESEPQRELFIQLAQLGDVCYGPGHFIAEL